mmetsp:Transcript_5124/g.17882  ORF Transcript_5124/g.17882 Transcript_5124/m.17882 type:complete len:451 (-) Transcript_5124:111-1463(-)
MVSAARPRDTPAASGRSARSAVAQAPAKAPDAAFPAGGATPAAVGAVALTPLAAMNVSPFLFKTYNLVSDPSTDHVLAWTGGGKTFTVFHPDLMEKELLPSTFKHANFASFVRQLNNYGFRKLQSERMEFGVANFEQGRPDLLKHLKRHDANRHQKKMARLQEQRAAQSAACPAAAKGAAEEGTLQLTSAMGPETEAMRERERLMMMREIMRLREEHLRSQEEQRLMGERLHQMEETQKQLLAFVQHNMDPSALASATQGRKRPRITLGGRGGSARRAAQPAGAGEAEPVLVEAGGVAGGAVLPSNVSLFELPDDHGAQVAMHTAAASAPLPVASSVAPGAAAPCYGPAVPPQHAQPAVMEPPEPVQGAPGLPPVITMARGPMAIEDRPWELGPDGNSPGFSSLMGAEDLQSLLAEMQRESPGAEEVSSGDGTVALLPNLGAQPVVQEVV